MAVVAAMAIAASITGIRNGFAYDDVHVIVKNPDLHTLSHFWNLFFVSYWRPEYGSFLYRPLTSIGFAVQWIAGNGSPLPFHVVSILLYAACSIALYRLALAVAPARAAIAAAIIFAIHPLHVEAVANVTGQSELWVALLLVVAVDYYVRLRRTRLPDWRDIATLGAIYLVACGFKEHAIVLPGLIAAAELTVVPDRRSLGARFRSLLPLVVVLVVVAAVFVTIRQSILIGVADDSTSPLLKGQGFSARLFTMLSVVMEWVRLFVWPADLSADYSFSRLRVYSSFDPVMIPGILALVGAFVIAFVVRATHRAFTFGMSWAGLALLIPSNLVVVTGFVLAERTLFMASFGIAICLGVCVNELWKAVEGSSRVVRYVVAGALLLAAGSFMTRSLTRNPVWRDNETLFRQTVEDVPGSGRAHWMLAAHLFEHKQMREALQEMNLAVVLGGQNDFFMLGYAGDMFATSGRCPRALKFYLRAMELNPDDVRVRANTARCLVVLDRPQEAKAVVMAAGDPIVRDPRLADVARSADSLERVLAAR
jgi:hypothetical protein